MKKANTSIAATIFPLAGVFLWDIAGENVYMICVGLSVLLVCLFSERVFSALFLSVLLAVALSSGAAAQSSDLSRYRVRNNTQSIFMDMASRDARSEDSVLPRDTRERSDFSRFKFDRRSWGNPSPYDYPRYRPTTRPSWWRFYGR